MIVVSLLQVCKHRVREEVTRDDLEQYGIAWEDLVEQIADIVSQNLDSGRAERVMGVSMGAEEPQGGGKREEVKKEKRGEGTEESSPTFRHPGPLAHFETYIDRVIATYLREHDRVEKLVAQDETTWRELGEQLAGSAYHILLRQQVPAARAVNDALDFAQQTCEAVLSHRFPYDVAFDAWTTVILRNQILQRYTRSPDLMDRESESLSLDRPDQSETDDDFSLYAVLADTSSISPFEKIEVQEWLIQAIDRLPSQAQQQVIVDTFFYELTDDEIAQRLHRTKQAIYSLRHRALRRLHQMLEG